MATAHSILRCTTFATIAFILSGCLPDSGDEANTLSPTELAPDATSGGGSSPGGGDNTPPPPPPPPSSDNDSTGKAEPVVLYSYDPQLVNAAPVDGAEAEPTMVYLFAEPSDEWVQRGIRHVDYFCCEGIEGPGAGESHGPKMSVSYKPWSLAVDLSVYEPGGVRRMEVVATFEDGSVSEKRGFRFNIAGGPEPNTPPQISGTPPSSVVADSNYSFTPDAMDPDGDTIAFSIANKPVWASFDSVTGRLRGTPGTGDIGEYRDIHIYVSDGETSTALGPFTIIVEPTGVGSVTLSWQPPTEREDGTPLTALAGYRLFYGRSSRDYTEEVRIDNPGVTTHVIDNLGSGTWYFAMTAIDADGLESDLSAEATRAIP